MSDVTFIIPIGPAHQQVAQRALDSVQAQTIRCAVAALVDTERQGPGVLRNRMLKDVRTTFVAFLDADDWIEPTWAAETIAEYQRIGGNRYIFTDWIDDFGAVVETPCLNGPNGYPISVPDRKPYCGGTWHVLTALIPTDWARAVGGFDESLPGSEDTDFFLKLCTTLRCGHRLARPLFHYAANGGRALAFSQHPDYQRVKQAFLMRYGGQMGCCGEQRVALPIGQKQDGDVLAMALWHGNRTEYGRATGRSYPRISMPKTAWVDPRDVAAAPQLWRVIEEAPQPTVDTVPSGTLQTIAQAGMATVVRTNPNPYVAPINEPPAPPVEAKPDVNRVIRLANQRGGNTDEPIFIFPEKDYPSYADIKALVKLAGFEARTMKGFDAFSRRPLIVVSPEPPGDLNGLRARVICWQLEYAGDYTDNYKGFTGEVWASDKVWAEAHGAKYVLMGSHPDLLATNHAGSSSSDEIFDVTMLAYMTPRRQIIKDKLANLDWTPDYPGHGTDQRDAALRSTRLMLHVHQHDNAPFVAPQRLALAAAYHMPIVSERTPGIGELDNWIVQADYDDLAATVQKVLKRKTLETSGDKLHEFLCVDRTFRKCVLEALKS